MTEGDKPRSPLQLWVEAEAEHRGDPDAIRARYRQLMVEHGHLIKGTPRSLPCGWPEATR